jgi:hypothetical protein
MNYVGLLNSALAIEAANDNLQGNYAIFMRFLASQKR